MGCRLEKLKLRVTTWIGSGARESSKPGAQGTNVHLRGREPGGRGASSAVRVSTHPFLQRRNQVWLQPHPREEDGASDAGLGGKAYCTL